MVQTKRIAIIRSSEWWLKTLPFFNWGIIKKTSSRKASEKFGLT
jgi:hypothetical protein